MLSVSQLSCLRQKTIIFQNISFDLLPREAILIQGPNGSGKSSLLRLLAGLSLPHAGKIGWHGIPIQHTEAYHQASHYLGHTNGLKLNLTIAENLSLFATIALKPVKNLNDIIATLNLPTPTTQTRLLSAGQLRRLALAKLLLIPKPLWLLDEPLTALDTDMQTLFLTMLEDHLQKGGMAAISTHQPLTFSTIVPKQLRFPLC